MAPDKSLAAEIEAMTLLEAIAYLKPDAANNGTISLKAARARRAVEVIEEVVTSDIFRAAWQIGGARQGTVRLKRRAAAFDHQAALAEGRDFDSGYQTGVRDALQAAGLWDDPLPLQPEGERSDA